MSIELTTKDIEEAFDNLYSRGYTYVDTRQLLSLDGREFTNAEWKILEPDIQQMVGKYLERVVPA